LKENTAESLDYKGLAGFDEHFYAKLIVGFCIKVFFISQIEHEYNPINKLIQNSPI
jgi:hypothetical protein